MARPSGTKYLSVQEMEEEFNSYVAETKSNPFRVQDYVGRDGDMVYREKERCLTMEGFEIFLYKKGYICTLKDYFSNRDERYNDYVPICSHIRLTIRKDQIEGGMSGVYNPSITQRLNGLVEKTQSQITVEQPLFPDVPKDDSGKQDS